MKPLPSDEQLARAADRTTVTITGNLPVKSPAYSPQNRKIPPAPVQRVYPWLLFSSTIVAGVFCMLYITKPVTLTAAVTTPALTPPDISVQEVIPPPPEPSGEKAVTLTDTPSEPLVSAEPTPFEETNLRVQHVLTAETPGGDLSRIVIDVPVLYESRQLRWTEREVAEARELLHQLADYQEKTRTLRGEGMALLDKWNQLVERAIPHNELRADSPTLPANQEDAASAPRPVTLDTSDAIRIQPAGQQ